MEYLFLINYCSTLIMTGAIWLAQLSQYPLLAFVGPQYFIEYEKQHIKRISFLAWSIITIELITGLLLTSSYFPILPKVISIICFVLILINFLTTWFIQFPIHKKLSLGFNTTLHKKLVTTNWIRTIAWSLRSLVLSYFLISLLA